MAEQLFVALYTDADVTPKSANGERCRSLIRLFASCWVFKFNPSLTTRRVERNQVFCRLNQTRLLFEAF
jgi:hypothetical protein